MKVSQREKILLGFLIVAALVAAYYLFILQPQMDNVSKLKAESIKIKAKAQSVKKEIDPIDDLQDELTKLDNDIKTSTLNLFPSIQQSIIIDELNKMTKDINLQVVSLAFTEPEAGEVDGQKISAAKTNVPLMDLVKDFNSLDSNNESKIKSEDNKEQNQNNDENIIKSEDDVNDEKSADKKKDEKKSENEKKVQKMTVTLGFIGKYDGVTTLMQNIEKFDRKIIIKSLAIKNEEYNKISGAFILDFYAIPKLHDQDSDLLKWKYPDNFSGDENPFNPFAGYISGKATSLSASSNQIKQNSNSSVKNNTVNGQVPVPSEGPVADFALLVKPFSSDMPSVIIGKANDSASETYAYADNKYFEDVELQIFQEGKKYYYKYKTNMDQYPDDYVNGKVEFIPTGKVANLFIFSNKRLGPDDNSGVNLSLINNTTDIPLEIFIIDDDQTRSRINIVKKVGNVY